MGTKHERPLVDESHPLRVFFLELLERNFNSYLGLRDQEITAYISNMLVEFCHAERLYAVHDASGRPLADMGEMLLEADPVYGPAPSFDRERQVRKHIGDYSLFFTGMFPESINRWRLRRQRLEGLVDFVKAGKESYYIVSKFDSFEYARVAPLFGRLAREFENCVFALNTVKNELQEMQHPIVRRTDELVM